MMEVTDGRKKRALKTRKLILEGARRVFLRDGYAGASMKAIAVESGVTQSLLHHHFGAKQKLWEAVQEHGFQEVLRAMRPVVSRAVHDADFPERLFLAYFDYLHDHPDYVRLLGWTYLTAGEESQSLPGQATQLVEAIRRLQRQGKLSRALDPSVCLVTIWTLAEGWFLGRIDYERRLGNPPEGDAVMQRFREGAAILLRKALVPATGKPDIRA